ncbi:MAG: hypothetical protein ACRCR2_03690 [Fusobacteriaceae bacterium]
MRIIEMNQLIEGYNSKFKKEALNKLYTAAQQKGYSVSILNEKYLVIEGTQYQIRVSKGKLIVKEF